MGSSDGLPSDIQLQHESIDQAADELNRAAANMDSNLTELSGKLQQFVNSDAFQGAAATACQEVIKVIQQRQSGMLSDLQGSAATLNSMHETMKRADGAAAAGYGQ